jgi:hypothetical protein
MKTSPVLPTCLRVALVVMACLASASTWAQWQWIDGQGKNVFSDIAPPTSVPEKNILRKPGLLAPDAAPAASPAPAPSELGKKVEEMKSKEDAQALAQKERDAQQLADNCNRARRSQAGLQTGTRIGITNDKGEQDMLSDQARAAELQRIDEYIQGYCR